MKTLQESIIGRKGIVMWPNPYNLTKNDAVGYLAEVSLEIISLALKEMEEQNQFMSTTSGYLLMILQNNSLSGCFDWSKTKEGMSFWRQINYGDFDVFYRTYTPAKLKKRLGK